MTFLPPGAPLNKLFDDFQVTTKKRTNKFKTAFVCTIGPGNVSIDSKEQRNKNKFPRRQKANEFPQSPKIHF